jgi:twitching motility protein PilJ
LVAQLVEINSDGQLINIAARQRMLTQRIAGNVARALQGGEDAIIAADRFGRDVGLFGRVLNALRNGDELMQIEPVKDADAVAKLDQLDETYSVLNELISDMLEKSIELFQVQEGAGQVFEVSEFLVDDTNDLIKAFGALDQTRLFTAKRGLIVGAITLALLLLLGIVLLRNARRQRILSEKLRLESESARGESDAQNQRNQEAILRLLDEISDLADGDLSVRATVTEDFTGAIADSINYAIDAMRDLVTAINTTTLQVSSASQETQATAMHLAEASDHQAQEISSARAAINEMATTMEHSAEEAGRATQVAQNAVETAKRGGEAVGTTIQAMDGIREQIQETSKRIKRLGESSQEIGEIVGLINDIADQTNILALNAAIQAAMAGEAGRGFAVVADEVQRLAERVGNATKQIDALVRTIQTDTNEAVISMEESTAGVVRGSRLAEAAGQSLEEVERESDGIAKLINELSQTSQQQAQAAERISETVNVIQEITTQTSAGTNETATSIGQLAKLANELGRSVAGFKLPSN